MRQPKRVLDLFCGAGGAAMGLHRAWPDAEIVGVDIKPQPRYPFRFIKCDALDCIERAEWADFIWASPPCQKNVKGLASVNVARGRSIKHVDLIPATRNLVCLKPHVIENVIGASLINPIMLCGSMFSLSLRRHRKFECSFLVQTPNCNHSIEKKYGSNWRPNGRRVKACAVQVYGTPARGEWPNWKKAMGIDWMTREELAQAIPPAYSEYIAQQWSAGDPKVEVKR